MGWSERKINKFLRIVSFMGGMLIMIGMGKILNQ